MLQKEHYMEYCTFTFKVHYINKKIKSDVAPYRGEHIDEESLREFVIENFSGAAGSLCDGLGRNRRWPYPVGGGKRRI